MSRRKSKKKVSKEKINEIKNKLAALRYERDVLDELSPAEVMTVFDQNTKLIKDSQLKSIMDYVTEKTPSYHDKNKYLQNMLKLDSLIDKNKNDKSKMEHLQNLQKIYSKKVLDMCKMYGLEDWCKEALASKLFGRSRRRSRKGRKSRRRSRRSRRRSRKSRRSRRRKSRK